MEGYKKYEDHDHYVIEQSVAEAIKSLKTWMTIASLTFMITISGAVFAGLNAFTTRFEQESSRYTNSVHLTRQEHQELTNKVDELLQILK